MTTTITRMSHQRCRTAGILGTSLVAALLLAGCSSPAPRATTAATSEPTATATATPTPTAAAGEVDAPQSAEEAIAGATAAAQTYLDIRAEIEVEHPDDSSAIDTIAVGDVAATVHDIAAAQTEAGTISTGHYAFEVTEPTAGDLTAADGTVYPFGAVNLTGCFITTDINSTNADGTPVAVNSNRRGLARMMVYYVATEKKWLLMELGATEEVNVPC
jgi:hypothetical protein